VNRRKFVKGMLAAAAAANIAPVMAPLPVQAGPDKAKDKDKEDKPSKKGGKIGAKRRHEAYRLREQAARFHRVQPVVVHQNNGDEDRYPNKIASYSKGLPHNHLGEVDLVAYQALTKATTTGDPDDFAAIPLGSPTATGCYKLKNPQAGLAFDLEGADSQAVTQAPAPAFASAEEAAEIIENYWMALLRDVRFDDYANNELAHAAAADLSNKSDFRGPKIGGQVTPATLFRGLTPGDLTGPYISQFLLLPAPFGACSIEQRLRTYLPGVNFMTSYENWLNIQRGFLPLESEQFDPVRRYIRNGRDLSQWVHIDVLYQAYFHAMMILLHPPELGGIGAPFDAGNPYGTSRNQSGFGTFGPPHIAALMCEVATRALKAVWFQKWFVHNRLRPEAFAGRIHFHLSGAATYPIHPDALNSPALDRVFNTNGTWFLPQAFPEGSPTHPAYGGGHATVAGACVTILKAWFDESFVIPNPVVVAPNGTSLLPYSGPPLTVGGELNKVASNVAFGRNIAGVHWRSDAVESLKLGEAVAISVLRDQRACYNEDFGGFTLTKFDGTTVTV
jgi:membrane-associated phospholipid phosphatase